MRDMPIWISRIFEDFNVACNFSYLSEKNGLKQKKINSIHKFINFTTTMTIIERSILNLNKTG